MATTVHRTTKEVIINVKPADAALFDVVLWLVDPDLTGVVGVPSKHWNIVGDVVTEMTAQEKVIADDAILSSERDSIADNIDFPESYERAFALLVLDEINLHSSTINSILTAIDSATSLAEVKANISAISDLSIRTPAQLKMALRANMD